MNLHHTRRLYPLSFLILTLVVTGCSTSPKKYEPLSSDDQREAINIGLSADSIEALREIEKEILAADEDITSEGSQEVTPPEIAQQKNDSKPHHVPIEINEQVRKWIYFFTVKDRTRFQRFMDRGSQYRPLIESILKEHNVPTDLYYLAMIESGFVTHARSHASAVGVWQFIRETGKRYGLDQNWYLDERKDVVRATEAAAKYLKNLNRAFQSWYLAMAGYNAGEGRILRAILQGKTRNFWTLVEKKALPPETRNYVPKFLAALIIGKHPEKYGFIRPGNETVLPQLAAVKVPGGVRFSRIASVTGVSTTELKKYNPHLSRKMTPANYKEYELWVPKSNLARVLASTDQLERYRVKARRNIASVSYARVHRVRRGESLYSIARKYRTSIANLKSINRLRSTSIQIGQRIKVRGSSHRSIASAKRYHRVRRGEALSQIARRYRISLGQLKRLNGLKKSMIYAGQRLLVSHGS